MKNILILLGGIVLGLVTYFGYTQTKPPYESYQQNNFTPLSQSQHTENIVAPQNTPEQPIKVIYPEDSFITQSYNFYGGGGITLTKPAFWPVAQNSDLAAEVLEFQAPEAILTISFEDREWGGAKCENEQVIYFKNKTATACVRTEEHTGTVWYGFMAIPFTDTKGYRVDVLLKKPIAENEVFVKKVLKTIEFK